MKYGLLEWLVCPACRASDLRLETRRTSANRTWAGQLDEGTPGYDPSTGELVEVEEGSLTCPECGQVYPIVDGVPRMALEDKVLTPSAHIHTVFDASAPEWEKAFLDYASPLTPDDFLGRLCLDVGCGFGRGAFFAARYGAEVVALDLDPEIIATCRHNTREHLRVHPVQGDAACMPFRAGSFELVYAYGLLHHLEDPMAVFHQCSRMVSPGGRFSLWVYGPRQGTTAAISALLRGMVRDMPSEELLNVSKLIASVLRIGSHTPYRLFRHLPAARSVVSHLPLHEHHRWSHDVVVADIYDRLRIPVTRTFTREELEARFGAEGYLDVRTSRRVGNNESYRATGVRR